VHESERSGVTQTRTTNEEPASVGSAVALAKRSDSVAFSRRLANLLRARRVASGESLRHVARRSDGRYSLRALKEIEGLKRLVDEGEALDLAALYGADLGDITGERLPIEVQPVGLLHTGGVIESFDPDDEESLLSAYLVLVRRLRRQEHAEVVDLRRDDVEVLAGYLRVPGVSVVERLASLMGATRARRTSMALLFGAGAAVIGVATGAAALTVGGGGEDGPSGVVPDRSVVVAVTTGPATVTDAPAADDQSGVTDPPTSAPDATVPAVTLPPVTPSAAPAATVPAPSVAPVPPATPAPAAPPPPPATAAPATTSPPLVEVGPPPVPPIESPPPEDVLQPNTPVEVEPPPPVVPPEPDTDVVGDEVLVP
jgi:hypothetical protein